MKKLRAGIMLTISACMTLFMGMNVLAAECEGQTTGHTPGTEVYEADWNKCNGGYQTDYYECIYCYESVDANGNLVERFEGTDVHTPGTEVKKADHTPCKGGFEEDYYLCDLCGHPTDKEGYAVYYKSGTNKHTPGTEKHAAYYVAECAGGVKEDFYFCTVCNWFCDANGETIIYYPGTGEHAIVKQPAKEATYSENGNIAYWYCEVCGIIFAEEAGINRIEDINDVIIPKLEKTENDESKADTNESESETEATGAAGNGFKPETEAIGTGGNGSSTSKPTESPATGDSAPIVIMTGLMVLSVVVLGVSYQKLRKR